MKTKILITLIVQLSCLAAISQAKADTPSDDLPISNEIVAKTVAWQLHWDEKASVSKKRDLKTIGIKNNDEIAVRVSPLDWIINFGSRSNQVFPNYIDKLEGPQDEVRQRAEEPFTRLKETIVNLPSYANSFMKVSALKADLQVKLLDAFKAEACSSEMLEFYGDDPRKPIKLPRFWIAPVDPSFPVMLYYVEGLPYIGKVYFDTKTLKSVYSEYKSIGEKRAPWYRDGVRLMKAIKAEGDVFEFKNLHRTKSVSNPANQPTAYTLKDSVRTNGSNTSLAGGENQLIDGQYVVASGDTIVAVCQKFQISTEELQTNNPGLHPKYLKVGQRLKIQTKPRQSD